MEGQQETFYDGATIPPLYEALEAGPVHAEFEEDQRNERRHFPATEQQAGDTLAFGGLGAEATAHRSGPDVRVPADLVGVRVMGAVLPEPTSRS